VAANHKVVEIPASNLKKEITKILFDQGYILSYKFEDNAVQGSIKIALKYDKDTKESKKPGKYQVLQPFQESLMD
jgi:small subunit ribosomal protein S8